MQTENTNRPPTGLFAAPVVTAEPAADAPPARTPEPARMRPRPPRRGSRRVAVVAVTALMVMLVLVLGLVAAHRAPAPRSGPAPRARGPKAPPPLQQRVHATVGHTAHKRARVARPHNRSRDHHGRRAQHALAARPVARPVVAAPAPAPVRAAPDLAAPYWRPAPAPVRSEEFF